MNQEIDEPKNSNHLTGNWNLTRTELRRAPVTAETAGQDGRWRASMFLGRICLEVIRNEEVSAISGLVWQIDTRWMKLQQRSRPKHTKIADLLLPLPTDLEPPQFYLYLKRCVCFEEKKMIPILFFSFTGLWVYGWRRRVNSMCCCQEEKIGMKKIESLWCSVCLSLLLYFFLEAIGVYINNEEDPQWSVSLLFITVGPPWGGVLMYIVYFFMAKKREGLRGVG